MSKINKVLYNISQSLNDNEKLQARTNIGAHATDDFNTYASNTAATIINLQRTLSNKQDILTARR